MSTAVAGTMRMSSVGVGISFGAAIALLAGGLVIAQIVLARPHAAQIAAPPRLSVAAAVTPDPASILDTATFATTFQASSEISEPLRAQLEVRSAADGATVLTMSQSGFRVPAEGRRAVYWEWRVPDRVAPGSYTVSVKAVGVNSGTVYGEEQKAATFQVTAR